jgi:hypothetical protein
MFITPKIPTTSNRSINRGPSDRERYFGGEFSNFELEQKKTTDLLFRWGRLPEVIMAS